MWRPPEPAPPPSGQAQVAHMPRLRSNSRWFRRPVGSRRAPMLTMGPNAWSVTPPTPPVDPMGTRSDPSSSPPSCAAPCPCALPPPAPNNPFSASKAGRRQAVDRVWRGCRSWPDRSPCEAPPRRLVCGDDGGNARGPLIACMSATLVNTQPSGTRPPPDQGTLRLSQEADCWGEWRETALYAICRESGCIWGCRLAACHIAFAAIAHREKLVHNKGVQVRWRPSDLHCTDIPLLQPASFKAVTRPHLRGAALGGLGRGPCMTRPHSNGTPSRPAQRINKSQTTCPLAPPPPTHTGNQCIEQCPLPRNQVLRCMRRQQSTGRSKAPAPQQPAGGAPAGGCSSSCQSHAKGREEGE